MTSALRATEVADLETPIDRFVGRRADITVEDDRASAIERFARRHDAGELSPLARRHRELLPMATPGAGEQYAFDVDLDACTGCKACVTACHSLNGLDDGEAWRAVGTLVAPAGTGAAVQHVTTACHHCVDPACLAGCPVDAYEKDPVTGIVAHLDDQCIGCRYCQLTCPYEVPRFNEARGIVRKCDLCQGRLAVGEAPACAQACPNSAITVAVVETASVRVATRTGRLVPGAPASSLTAPTTAFRGSRIGEGTALRPPDVEVAPAHGHPPLAVMLVLTQVAVGSLVASLVVDVAATGWLASLLARPLTLTGAVAGVTAMAASVGHLGRPLQAWRAVVGVRHSWLSREIVAFGGFGALAAGAAARPDHPGPLWLAAGTGLAGVVCSVLVYVVTGRACWRPGVTATRFTLTTMAGGLATVLAVGLAVGAMASPDPDRVVIELGQPVATALAAVATTKLTIEALELRHVGRAPSVDPRVVTAVLRYRVLRRQTVWRFALGVAGGIALPVVVAGGPSPGDAACFAVVGAVLLVAGELVERLQFFTTAAAPRMPGMLP